MVSVCLLSHALLQSLPSYLDFSYLGHRISLHSCSSKVQPLFLTLDEGYLLTVAPPDLERGVAPLGPPVPAQPPLLGRGVAPLGSRPWPRTWVAPLGRSCAVSDWYSRPLPVTSDMGYLPYFTSVIHHGKAFRECCRNLRLIIKCAYSIIIFSNWKIHMFTYL